jgi:mannose-6-phosphate isomerase-like protein (cupin superfamily)
MSLGTPMEADLVSRLVCLHPDGGVRTVDATEFWAAASQGADPMEHGHEILVSVFSYDRDWDTAEQHPVGDEPTLVVEGALTMLLDVDGLEQSCHVEAGTWCVVPAGVWHRALVHRPTRALHLTPGRGTRHRPAPDVNPEAPEPAAALVVDAVGATISVTDGVATTGPDRSQWHAALGGSVRHQSRPVVLVDLDTLVATVVPAGALPGIDELVGPRTLVLAHGAP